jgi:hypothetical protein
MCGCLEADIGVASCCCNNHLNETFLCYGVSILDIYPMDSAVLGMINVKKLQGKSITLYLHSHQIQDPLTAQWHELWQVQVA